MSDFCQLKWVNLPIVKAVILCELLLIGIGHRSLQQVSANEAVPITGKQWLDTMTQAMHTLNYQGTVVYLLGDQVETMNVFHAVDNGVEQERMVSLNDPMREVIRDANKVTCYFPDTRTMIVDYKPSERPFLLSVPDDLHSEDQRYIVNLGVREHVTQRLAQVVSIDPVDNLRYARRIWIDIESKLPLKYEVFNEYGKIIEQMVFTSFSVEEYIPLKFLNAATKMGEFSWQVRNKESIPADRNAWMFKSIPEGFKQVLYTRRKMPASKQPVEHILLSDGFASVSVYVDQFGNKGIEPRQKSLGAINSYSLQIKDHQITVMGEVPAKTVKMIGDGIYFQANEIQ